MSVTDSPAPDNCPFVPDGKPQTINVPHDALTSHGNVVLPAGLYTAWLEEDGSACVWSEGRHYTSVEWVSLPPWDFSVDEGPPPPIPDHDCIDYARSGTVDGFYCGMCRRELWI